ncbi:MAG TPA: hypothetical protein VFF40_00905 [Acidimicrobiia bacterium]|nr:hypothetical protein [Acidimicrobiia bacterium]
MRRRSGSTSGRATGERGSAIVEFVVLGVGLFGVLIQVIVLFGVLQRSSLATAAAAREVGRAVVLAENDADAARRTDMTVDEAAANHGLGAGSLEPRVTGHVARGERIRVSVSTDVPVLHIPFVGPVWPSLSIPVEATHVVRVDRYRSFP